MFLNSWFKYTIILYLTSKLKSEQNHMGQEGSPRSSRPPWNTTYSRGHSNLSNNGVTATPFSPPCVQSFCYILQEHYLTKNFTSIREHFQNLPMMSKGIIKTCPNFISSTTKKSEYWIFSFPPNWQSLFSIFPTILGRKTILSRKLPLISSTFKTKPLFFTSSPHSRRLR